MNQGWGQRRGPGAGAGAGAGKPSRGAGGQGTRGQGGQPPRRRRPAVVTEPPPDLHDPDGVRLQKVLASAGVGSRRACEQLIADGRVTIDGHVVRELGIRVDPRKAVVHVDGLRVQLDEALVTLAFNKPVGVISAMTDPQGRSCLGDFVTNREERLFHVGRLDVETEGLILLTNDGELSHRLAHPSFEIPKTYLVLVQGSPARDIGRRLMAGVELEDGLATVDSFKMVDSSPGKALIELVLHDGRNRIVRRLMDEVGHPVENLVRVQVGPIRLGDLRSGRTRVITGPELGSLMAAVDL